MFKKRYYVALMTATGVVAGIIIGDFDKGIKQMLAEHKRGDVTDIISVTELPPLRGEDNIYNELKE